MIACTQTHVGKSLLGQTGEETIEVLLVPFWFVVGVRLAGASHLHLSALIGPDVLGTVERGPFGCRHLHRYPNPPPHQLPSGNLYVRPDEGFIVLNLIFV